MSVGRGRGIRRETQATSPQINTSQDVAPVRWTSPLDTLAILVAVLDTNDVQQLNEVEAAITKYCTDVEKMRLLIDDLHERSLADSEFGVRAAASLATKSLLVVEEVKLRGLLIQNLQNDFTQSDKLRKENQPRFLNAVAFLAEVFQRVRLADNLPIAVLAIAHFLYQKKLLQGDQYEHELFVKLWAQFGPELKTSHPTEFNDLLMATHSSLIADKGSNISRAWLLLAIHIYHHDFQPITESYLRLFEATLNKEALTLLQQVLSANGLVSSVEKLKVSERIVNTAEPSGRKVVQNVRESVPNGDRGSVFNRLGPRPADTERRWKGGAPRDDRNDSANWLPKPVPSANDISNWGLERSDRRSYSTSGHDDRCDKDYYDKGRNGQQRGRDNYSKAGNLQVASKQDLPDDENWD